MAAVSNEHISYIIIPKIMILTMKPVTCLTRSIKGGSFEKKNHVLYWLSVRFSKIILYLTFKSFISHFLFYIVPVA